MNRKQFEYDKAVWNRVVKCEQKAEVLANIYRVADRVNERLISEGKTGLYEQIRQKRLAKQNTKTVVDTQEPTGIKAAILHASLIGLLVIICSTMVHAFPGNA
jgi:CRISPR/Cas system CMR-associated protein Cmr1 (group 7 of RAMP superfamily)